MPHPKQHITDLADICKRRNINHVIISPGSRSAPLIRSFFEAFGESCVSIVDERSAAYFALGTAIYNRKPAVLICTSGTAVLNYAPALAEAYYQQIPLLAVTADRPHEWIDQQDNQTIRQNGIYKNYVKGSFELPQLLLTDDDLWYAHRQVNDALNLCTGNNPGPVHINVPLTEPLYDDIPPVSLKICLIVKEEPEITLKLPPDLLDEWNKARKIMIIHGQDFPGSGISAALKPFMNDPRMIVIAENISNIAGRDVLSNSNLVLSLSRGKSPGFPDLVLHSGGQVVSKALTGYLRRSKGVKCWRIGTDDQIIDTFRLATRVLPYPAHAVYRALYKSKTGDHKSTYRESWLAVSAEACRLAEDRLAESTFTDMLVFKKIMSSIPAGAAVVLGNSSVIRYSQLFPAAEKLHYYSNRGVSGIDGSLSTAAGIAFASGTLTISVVGDLGFLYDSNALWNRELPSNLRIVVINNQGGGIFHIIKGPSDHPGFKKFVEAHHPVNIAKLAEAYGLKYMFADDERSLANQWSLFTGRQSMPAIFEIRTDAAASALAFRKLMAAPS